MAERNTNEIHIGRLIQEQLKTDQRSVSWLAKQIPFTRNHIYKIFRKSSIDCALLLRISQAMGYNFFRYYAAEVAKGMKERIGEE